MRKLAFMLIVSATMFACTNPASTKATTEDTTKCKVDSVKTSVDSVTASKKK